MYSGRTGDERRSSSDAPRGVEKARGLAEKKKGRASRPRQKGPFEASSFVIVSVKDARIVLVQYKLKE